MMGQGIERDGLERGKCRRSQVYLLARAAGHEEDVNCSFVDSKTDRKKKGEESSKRGNASMSCWGA